VERERAVEREVERRVEVVRRFWRWVVLSWEVRRVFWIGVRVFVLLLFLLRLVDEEGWDVGVVRGGGDIAARRREVEGCCCCWDGDCWEAVSFFWVGPDVSDARRERRFSWDSVRGAYFS